MKQDKAIIVFESLSSPIRLEVYRLLVRAGPDGMVAGEISAAVGQPPAHLSFHLKALNRAGLLEGTQEGRYQRYRANLVLMAELIAYLTEECCAGHPELCIELTDTTSPQAPIRAATSGRR